MAIRRFINIISGLTRVDAAAVRNDVITTPSGNVTAAGRSASQGTVLSIAAGADLMVTFGGKVGFATPTTDEPIFPGDLVWISSTSDSGGLIILGKVK